MRRMVGAAAAVLAGACMLAGCGPKMTEQEKTLGPPPSAANPRGYTPPPAGASGAAAPPAAPTGQTQAPPPAPTGGQ